MWLSAAPAVTNRPDFTIMLDSSSRTAGYRRRNRGASHHVVVARCWSSKPDSASTKVPMHAAVIVAPRRAQCRSAAAASRTSGRASAVSSGPGILNPMAGTTTQSGTDAPIVRTGTLSPCEVFTVRRTPDNPQLEPRHRQSRQLDQLVRGLKGVEDRGEPQIEDAVEREDVTPPWQA